MLTTNINELLLHVAKVHKGLFSNKEFTSQAQKAGDAMKKQVQESMKVNGGRKDYHQSYQLKRTIGTQSAEIKSTETRANIGFGQIDDLNQQTKRRQQRATFTDPNGSTRIVKLAPEKELPSWVIMEFGRNGTAHKATTVPTFIKKEINYSPRTSKPLMFGPSTSLHMRAPIFFMTNKTMLSKHHGIKSEKGFSRHSGIEEGRFFRDGLENSKSQIHEALSKGIEASLRANLMKHGGGRVIKI